MNAPGVAPWGESFDDLAAAVLADKSAPPVLALAAFMYQRGVRGELRSLVEDAVALDTRGSAAAEIQPSSSSVGGTG